MAEVLEFVIQGKDEFSGVFDKLLRQIPLVGQTMAVAATAFLAAGAAIVKMSVSAAEAGNHFNQLSVRLGVSTTFIQEMEQAAYMADVSIELVERSLSRLSINISEATYKSGPAADAFERLGITLFDSSGKMKTAESIYPEIADAILKVGDASKQAELAGAIFGVRAVEMIQLLKQGKDGFQKVAEEAQRFGLIMSGQAIANATKFDDSMKNLHNSLIGVRNTIAERLIPIFTGLTDALTNLIVNNRTKIADFAEGIIKGFFYIYEVARRIFVTLGTVIGDGLGIIVDIVDAFWTAIKNKVSGKSTLETFKELGDSLSSLAEQIQASFKDIFSDDVFGTNIGDTVDGMVSKLFKLGTASKQAMNEVKESVADATDLMIARFNKWFGVWQSGTKQIQSLSRQVWGQFAQGVGDAVARAIVYGENLRDAFKAVGKQIVTSIISGLIQIGIQQLISALLTNAVTASELATRMSALSSETYAAAFASTAAIPLIGPELAPAVAEAAVIAMLAGAGVAAAQGATFGTVAGAVGSAGSVGGTAGGVGGGIAHGGLTDVPREETYLLQQGERVLSPSQNRDLKEFMAGGGGSGNIIIQAIHINSPMYKANWAEVMEKQFIPAFNNAVKRKVFVRGIS